MVRTAACLACSLCCAVIATASNPDHSVGTTTREAQITKIPRVDPRANVMQFPKRLLLNAQPKAGLPDRAPLPVPAPNETPPPPALP
jgi:hypothetical protein